MLAIRVNAWGGADKLSVEDVPVPEPGTGEVRVRVEAAGVNFVDTYERSGLHRGPVPFTIGKEVAGVVSALGAGVAGFKPGDRVATARASGGYASEAIVPAAQLVPVPAEIPTRTAAALMLQGLTAHYLACDTLPLKAGDNALVHAAAGGVGLLLVQIAKMRGARVIAAVGTREKAVFAQGAGADEVVVYDDENFTAAARRLTGGRGVDVVYDGVGEFTFMGSLDCLRPRGMLVSYGNASGPVSPFPPLLLSRKGSLYVTRPTLGDYTQTPAELRARAGDLFRWVASGSLQVRIGATFPLAAAADAHRALESRATTGKVLLIPDSPAQKL